MTTNGPNLGWRSLAAFLALCLIVASCGGDDGDAASPDASEETTEAESEESEESEAEESGDTEEAAEESDEDAGDSEDAAPAGDGSDLDGDVTHVPLLHSLGDSRRNYRAAP